jgi:pyruvate dehydrogenase E2 component (dihydrolipoamide acetyltransferase)
MALSVQVPRINNNDDTVKLVRIIVGVGDLVRTGDVLMEVETEKATIAVEAAANGYVLAINVTVGDEVPVGAC